MKLLTKTRTIFFVVLIVLLFGFLQSYGQVTDTIIFDYKTDTLHYNYLYYLEDTFVRCEPGIIILDGWGSEWLVGYYYYEPERRILTLSGKEIKKENLLKYY